MVSPVELKQAIKALEVSDPIIAAERTPAGRYTPPTVTKLHEERQQHDSSFNPKFTPGS